ncbi:MAG: beta-1,6-N-acetylglucosaminyltransferase [Plectolyngbya sp. WJT66-NPBG17]|jgi:hypothetical protein|nr:beta-1,6-N-acetylglucosaminyltransferase [Plectolyngbya sp. WJT66-NPBG17]MBW4526560.1 beta-1,6-N-acetylglucosaminyltransferase [Phormidium tanganyikae FI6-MK23]
MKVCYLIQTHREPAQIERLVRRIKSLSPNAQVLVSHDFTNCELKRSTFADLSDVAIIASRGGRGNFSIVQSYLDAIKWLLDSGSDFSWLLNLSGQDYPIQPLSQVEQSLFQSDYDGFVHHFEVFSKQSPWKRNEGYTRYHYRYRVLVNSLPEWQKELLKPAKILNYIQPFFRVNFSYGITLGLKISPPFTQDFVCYGGSFLCTLSRNCVEYLQKFVESNPDIIDYYKGVAIPDECFIQTILVNSNLFKLSNDCKRYFDFSQTRNGHPRILSSNDFPALIESQAHFARKFDPMVDSNILDLIDKTSLEKSTLSA